MSVNVLTVISVLMVQTMSNLMQLFHALPQTILPNFYFWTNLSCLTKTQERSMATGTRPFSDKITFYCFGTYF